MTSYMSLKPENARIIKMQETEKWLHVAPTNNSMGSVGSRTWAGHIARIQDNRWTSQVTDWRPMDDSRPRGRPSKRWRDEIDDFWRSVTWKGNAQKTDCHGKGMLRPSSNKLMCNGLI